MTDLDIFDFSLPRNLIAQYPAQERVSSKLLIHEAVSSQIRYEKFENLPDFLSSNDVLIYNEAKVIPARLVGKKIKTGGRIEFLWLEQSAMGVWRGLMGGKITPGLSISFDQGKLTARVAGKNEDGSVVIETEPKTEAMAYLEQYGVMPLPPYIKRKTKKDDSMDRERYQTIFAREKGSVAAPTAGLHFSETLVRRIKDKGVHMIPVHLRVGWGTFQKISDLMIADKKLHEEDYEITDENARRINELRVSGKRIIVIGTTTARALESSCDENGMIRAGNGKTTLFIMPGYRFRFVRNMITNFHLPKSSLYMLVCALIGTDKTRELYREAIQQQYRFYSYGDAMCVLKS